jgi:hypothetical protein
VSQCACVSALAVPRAARPHHYHRCCHTNRAAPTDTMSGLSAWLNRGKGYKEDFVWEELEAAIELYEEHEEEDK